MVKKAISQTKAGKASGPSGIVVEMIRAAGDMGASMIRDLTVAIIRDGKVPSDWEQNFIVYKGKGDALERGNYHGLKLTEQVMKILERIVDGLIRQLVSIDDSQFGFVPGRGTTDAIFVVRQLQEKYLAANKRLYMAFVDLEKVFDLVDAEKTWCGGVDCATGAEDVCKCTEPCPCWWGVQWRVWSEGWCSPRISTQSLLFIIVLEALSREFRSGVPWEDLYADDLVIIAESLEECVRRLLTWKEAMEKNGLRVNAGKTKIMICSPAEFRRVSMCCLSHWSGQQQLLLQWLQALGAQEMQWAQALEKGPWLQMYTVPGNCKPLGWQTTEGSPGQTWQAWGGSFLLLPRRHALSSRWLWTFNHNTCENRLEEVQGSAASPFFTPPLFQNM